MTLTLSVDDQLLERARQAAEKQGKDLNRLIVEYLEDLVVPFSSSEEDIEELVRLSGQGDSQGWKFNREEIYDRTKLP
jgi:hypothetical protein